MNNSVSLMTLLERRFYLNPGVAVNATWGYPVGLNPNWITDYQLHPPGDFLAVRPGELVAAICGYFREFLQTSNVDLAPTCSVAFAIAAKALTRSPLDEFVLVSTSYDSYPGLVQALGAKVAYARRTTGHSVSLESVRGACTEHERLCSAVRITRWGSSTHGMSWSSSLPFARSAT